jgi:hypothetical protein
MEKYSAVFISVVLKLTAEKADINKVTAEKNPFTVH